MMALSAQLEAAEPKSYLLGGEILEEILWMACMSESEGSSYIWVQHVMMVLSAQLEAAEPMLYLFWDEILEEILWMACVS